MTQNTEDKLRSRQKTARMAKNKEEAEIVCEKEQKKKKNQK